LTWREYSKELNAARGVFRNTPGVNRLGGRLSWGTGERTLGASSPFSEISNEPPKDEKRNSRLSSEETSNKDLNESFLSKMRRFYPKASKSKPSETQPQIQPQDPSSSSPWTYDHFKVAEFMKSHDVSFRSYLSEAHYDSLNSLTELEISNGSEEIPSFGKGFFNDGVGGPIASWKPSGS